MKLKNIRELVLRARAHVREDHVKQGTYGDVKKNGHLSFVGCAIGCLSTPHRKDELLAYLKEVKGHRDPFSGKCEFSISDADQRRKLIDEFGINLDLAIAAEGFFESQETHGAAIEFVKDFAEALVEGAEIVPSQVREWLRTHLGVRYFLSDWERGEYETYYQEIEERLQHKRVGEGTGEMAAAEYTQLKTEEFLDWLRTRKPATQ